MERGEGNKKPRDKIPTQIKDNQLPLTLGGDESRKRKSDSVSRQQGEKMKVIGEEAFVFPDENKMYRFVKTARGYTCPIFKMEFARIGQHLSTKQCG